MTIWKFIYTMNGTDWWSSFWVFYEYIYHTICTNYALYIAMYKVYDSEGFVLDESKMNEDMKWN